MEKGASEMENYISRQAAIDLLRDAENHAFNSFYEGLKKAHKIIADLPAADVRENKAGSWVPIGDEPDEDFECDRCGYSAHINSANDDLPIFCPNCGTYMGGKSDD